MRQDNLSAAGGVEAAKVDEPGSPSWEQARLAALHRYSILDTPDDSVFDRFVELARTLFDTPIAEVSLIDANRQWLKARAPNGPREAPRDWSFCTTTIQGEGVMVVHDARTNPLTRDSPFVTHRPFIRFYAGAPLRTPDGHKLGTLCVVSPEPREDFDAKAQAKLQALANLVMLEIERRGHQHTESKFVNHLLETSSDCIKVLDLDGALQFMNRHGQVAMGIGNFAPYQRRPWSGLMDEPARVQAEAALADAREGRTARFEAEVATLKGTRRCWDITVSPILGEDGRPERLLAISRDITERRAHEKALRESEARLQAERRLLDAVIRQAPIGISITSWPGGRSFALNDKAAELLGHWPQGEDLGRYRGFGAIHPDGRPYGPEDYPTVRTLRSGTAIEQEEMVYRLGGSEGEERRRLSVSSAPVRDEAGVIVAAVTAFSSIEAQRRAEEGLRASEARLREERARLATLIEHLPVGVGFMGDDGQLALSNPAFRVFLPDGRLPSQLAPGDTCWIAWDESGQPLARDRYPGARALRGETAQGIEFLFRPGDGRQVWTRVDGIPLRSLAGEITGAMIVIVDVSDERRAQADLRRLNETLETRVTKVVAERRVLADIVENSDAATIACSLHHGILALNPALVTAFERIYGKQPQVGDNLLDLLADLPEHRAQVAAHWSRAFGGEEFVVVETFGDPARERVPFEVRFSVLRDREGRPIGAAQTAYDISDRLRAETELEATQEALRQSQKMEAVGQLTGGLAHDFNNLLTGIIGALDLMQSRLAQGDTSRLDRYATAAMTSAQRAAALTHRLLAFARRQPLDPKPVDANRLVTGMEELLRRTLGETIQLDIATATDLWPTLCDSHQLESAILNLAINARDAMPDGGRIGIVTGTVELDRASAARIGDLRPGQYVTIEATDSGVGMTPEVMSRAFDPFFTTKPLGQGTGLGLSMIYGFVRQSNGHVQLRSRTSQGTTVTLYLPRHQGVTEGTGETRTETAADLLVSGGETVVVVEDEPIVRALVVEALAGLGYHIVEAEDGPSGLKLLQAEGQVDLLVTDIGLPGLNGRQLADAARAWRPELKVLFMTGYAETAAQASGFLDPGMEMMTKPFAIETLVTRVRKMIADAEG
ncbi:PAS domain S-box protein [Rubellimicrobium rubrum]|uniref:histidine kinase n=1 Tax=Rubellimicrobium rubrum TaxID=2585369 RepID=A0A5C4MW61_9RHOB|nr:PAS domain-containing protein [Rubellimicrobium rubrum]TNC49594.1 PAS domain S-box protein [Rubellimicrobium rubrum]